MNQFALMKKWQCNISYKFAYFKKVHVVHISDPIMDVTTLKKKKKVISEEREDMHNLTCVGTLKALYLDNCFCGLSIACQYAITYLRDLV